jgi:hypothetical protein
MSSKSSRNIKSELRTPKSERKQVFLKQYYDEDTYNQIKEELPEIVKTAERAAADLLEPTVSEKWKVIDSIKEFLRENPRKVYGGSGLNEALKVVNENDAIYDHYNFGDIEFYSYTPISDLIKLCNYLHDQGYQYVVGSEAQHEGTYKVFVNMTDFCDISYMPEEIYTHIKTIKIDGIDYVHPHFALIDQLKMFTNPLTAAWRWEKTFKRHNLLLKDYPLENFDKPIKIDKVDNETEKYFNMIMNEYMIEPESKKADILSGFVAYNFFIRTAAGSMNSDEKQARVNHQSRPSNDLSKMTVNLPYVEILSVDYVNTVKRLFNYIKRISNRDPTIDEYFPFIQYINYSCHIKLGDQIIARVIEGNGSCTSYIQVNSGKTYVCYQYLWANLLIEKFYAHVRNDQQSYFNYGSAVSNLIKARNIYLKEHNIGPLDDSVFKEFKVTCKGNTVSYERLSKIRQLERKLSGKPPLRYKPEDTKQRESIHAYVTYHQAHMPNISGEQIRNPKQAQFVIAEGHIMENKQSEINLEKNENFGISEPEINLGIDNGQVEQGVQIAEAINATSVSVGQGFAGGENDELDQLEEINSDDFI